MPRMIDLIRASAVPANIVQSASRGALAIPAGEMIEILVYLAENNSPFSDQAKTTLAGWNDTACKTVAADPATPAHVLDYLVSPKNLRPVLLSSLLDNPSIKEEALCPAVASVSRDVVDEILKNHRANRSQAILTALASNPNLTGIQAAAVEEKLVPFRPQPQAPVESGNNAVSDPEVAAFMSEHASDMAADAGKPYQPIGGVHDEPEAIPQEVVAIAQSSAAAAAPAKAEAPQKSIRPNEQRGSALQKISRLDITGRIQLAMKGTKEERSLLVRDGTKIVALAVLESPKISDGEVEKFASQKNVLEAVLRAIPLKRRFMKNYNIVRNLVFNPRTPIDLSLTLMKNLLVNDLKNLAGNKEVSDTVRKLALRAHRQKSEAGKKG
jgi:hypothetical protein